MPQLLPRHACPGLQSAPLQQLPVKHCPLQHTLPEPHCAFEVHSEH